ncbi:MAG: malic enzyme-like NAD(P)-binding protein [Pseudomonadota bacterium]
MFRRFFGARDRALAPYRGFEASAPPAPGKTLDEAALDYHRRTPPGKLSIRPTKELEGQRDLSLAYSPGVAAACRAIAADPAEAASLTARANTVAVISNGTAVLGLGDIGPLAAKPVMEGKAVLFHRFAGVNAFDLEVNETDPEKLAEIIIALEPSVGGVNLEDIRAPDCFQVEEICKARMNVPVFHDDQHGTAACILAALTNALELTGRTLKDIRLVCSGAGAAALATLDLLFSAGLPRDAVIVIDRQGVIHQGRKAGMNPRKEAVAARTRARTLEQALKGADVFLGVSQGGVLDPEWVKTMAPAPIILALANPDPEIWPEDAKAAAPDAIVATGRSDFPNQVNNVLCFPYVFRGALDAGAKEISQAMLIAAADAIAEVGRMPPSEALKRTYPNADLTFGPDSLMPRPFDDRLLKTVSEAVARAAGRRKRRGVTPAP